MRISEKSLASNVNQASLGVRIKDQPFLFMKNKLPLVLAAESFRYFHFGRYMSLRPILIVITTLVMSGISQASVLEVRAEAERQHLPEVEVFPRQSGSDEEVLARLPSMEGERVASSQKLGGAFQTAWLRFTLQNSSEQPLDRIIYLPNNYAARNLEFYYFRDGRLIEHKSYHQDRIVPSDVVRGRSSYSTILLPENSAVTVYMKVETGYEPLIQNFHLSTRQQFMNWEMMSTFFVGLFLGVLFLTILANLMQAVAYRDRAFVWYSGYCASLILISLSFYGIWVRLFALWELQMYMAFIGGAITVITGVLFMRLILDTKRLAPYVDRAFQCVAWFAVLTCLMRFFPQWADQGFVLHSYNTIVFMLLSIIAGVTAMIHGKELAWLYTSSFLFVALSVIYVRLSHMNLIPSSPSAFYAPAVGHIMQVILVSYVMFVRSRRAHIEALRSQRNHSMNERLNLLLKIISHDIANPLQAISLYCNMALHKVKAQKLPEAELLKTQEAIHTQTRIIKHAKEAVRQMQLGQNLQIQPVHASQILAEVLPIFQPLCQDRGIRLEVINELKEDIVIHTDATILVHNILGNILSNSIKFTPQDGLIRILVRCINRRIIFELIDNGPGISKEKRVEIFTLNVGKGFNEHLSGAGSFGLSILQMCTELLNGHLDIGPSSVSSEGQELGLKITVSLPLHHAL
jgi:signal transduction histidine kinase